jgi:DNA-directed RNA polymerase specialized sigma24 family protein
VVNCQLDDADALQQLMKIWYPKLLRYASRQLGNEQRAQVADQNTFELVSKTICKLKDLGSFTKWLYKIRALTSFCKSKSKTGFVMNM